jgi:hypothetical protein
VVYQIDLSLRSEICSARTLYRLVSIPNRLLYATASPGTHYTMKTIEKKLLNRFIFYRTTFLPGTAPRMSSHMWIKIGNIFVDSYFELVVPFGDTSLAMGFAYDARPLTHWADDSYNT